MKRIILFLTLMLIVLLCFNNYYKKEASNNAVFLKEHDGPEGDWFERQRAFPYSDIPNSLHIKAMEDARKMPAYDFDGSAVWTLAGPTNIEGRITSIAINPINPQIVYIGTANGGVWKSVNFCQSWVSVFDNENTSSIGSIAIDPSNANVIYSGTGESNSSRSYYPGTGIYKSTNGGTNWTQIGLDSTYCFGNIAINPLNTQEIYAAAVGSLRRKNIQRGIYKSLNGGTTWSLSLFHSDSVGAIDVSIDPSTPSRVFAAMWERQRREDYIKYGGPMTALYFSSNSGASWSIVNGGFPSNASDLGRIALDISVSNPQTIYALTAFTNGNSRGLYKSVNGGTSWTLINSGAGSSSSYAWYNRICRVSPADANNVIWGGLNMERSLNGGTSYSSLGTSHVDQHGIAFAPSNPNFIVLGNDGGIDYSTNGGTSFSASNSLPITQFYAGDIDNNNPNVILGGAQDNGTPRTLTGALNNWTDIYGGDGFYCLVDYNNSQNVYASSQYGALGRSVNGGNSFLSGTSGLDLTYTNWSTPYVMDKTNPQVLYCGTYKIFKSVNGMQSWSVISPDLTNGHTQNLGTITTVDVAKSNPNVIYCGTDDANVWVTTNGGTGWTKINTGLPYNWVTRVTIHKDSANVCYVALSGYKVDSLGVHLFKTTNYGSSWFSVSGNLPNAPVNDILIDPLASSYLYAATDVGVMASTNYGANWSVPTTGIPSSVPCLDLTFHTGTRKLVVWTHGRSAFSTILPSPVGLINHNEIVKDFLLNQNYPNPFNPVTTISYTLPKQAFVTLKIYDIKGRLVRTLISSMQGIGNYKAEFDGTNLASGVYFYKLTANPSDRKEQSDGYTNTKRMILVK